MVFGWNAHQLLFFIWILSQPSEGSFLNAALGLRIGLSPNEKGLDPSSGGLKGQFITGVQGKPKSGGWSKGDNGFIRHLKILGVNLYLGKQKYPVKNAGGGGWKPLETSGPQQTYTQGHHEGKEGGQQSHYYGHVVHDEGGPSTGYSSNQVSAVRRPEEKLVVYLPAASQYPKFSSEVGNSAGGPTYHLIPTGQTYPLSQGQQKPATAGQGFSLASMMKGPQWASNLKSRLRFSLFPTRGPPPPPLLMRTLNSLHSPSEKSPRGAYSTLFPAKLVGEPSSHPQFIHGRSQGSSAESRHPSYTYMRGGQVAHAQGGHQNTPTYMPKYISHFAHPPSTMPFHFNNAGPPGHTLGSPYSSGSQSAPKFQGSAPIFPNSQAAQSFTNSQSHYYNMIAGEMPMTPMTSSPVSFSPQKFNHAPQHPPRNFYIPLKQSSFPLDFPPPSFKPGNEVRNSFKSGGPSGSHNPSIQESTRPFLGAETENYFASEAQKQHSSELRKPSSPLLEFTPADTVQTYDFGGPTGSHFSGSQFESRPSSQVQSHPQSFTYPPSSNYQAQSGSEQQQFTQQGFPSDTQQFPPNNQQFPSNTQQFPSDTQQFPSNTQQFPSNTQQFPSNTQQFPSNTQQFPSNPDYTPEASPAKGQSSSDQPQFEALSQPQFGGQGYMEMFNPNTMQESMPYQLPDGFQYSHTVSSPIVSMGSTTRDDPPIMMDMGGDPQPAEYPSFSPKKTQTDRKRGSSLNPGSSSSLTKSASFPSLTSSKGQDTPRTLKKRKSHSSRTESMVTAASALDQFNQPSSLNSWIPMPPADPVTTKRSLLTNSIALEGASLLSNKNETTNSKRFFLRRRTTPTTTLSTTTTQTSS